MEQVQHQPQPPDPPKTLLERLARWGSALLLLSLALLFAWRAAGTDLPLEQERRQSPTATAEQPVAADLQDPLDGPAEGRVTPPVVGRPTPALARATPMTEPGCAIITDDQVHLREAPAGAIRAIANTGMPVTLLVERQEAQGHRWAKIRLDAVERWVAEQFVQQMPCE